jgi:hypothetical protein
MHLSKTLSLLSLLAAGLALPSAAQAHGFAGDRFFPATLTTDDPFVADEMSLPTVDTIMTPDGRQTDIGTDIALKLTPNFGISAGETFTQLEPAGARRLTGFNNVDLGAMYQFYENDKHEAILSLALDVEIGGTGRKLIGSNSYTTWTPSLDFGKGFGDLPNSLSLLKPLALTGTIGVAFPGDSSTEGERNPNNLELGFALEYSLIYLQEHVKDVGLRAPFNRLIPLVELTLENPLDRGQAGQITGTINPGIIWSGQYFQVGAEALIPINSRTGSSVGVLVQVHFYLDDLFPKCFGHPLFGGNQ